MRILTILSMLMLLASGARAASMEVIYQQLSNDERKVVDAVRADSWPLTEPCSRGYGPVASLVTETATRLHESGVITTHPWSAATGASPYFQAHCDSLGVTPTEFTYD